MSKIAEAFSSGKAFIPFVTCGDPDLETTKEIVLAMEEAGANMIELGIPFSDPTAEGPVIQAASLRALQSGTTTDRIFEMVRELRTHTKIPLVFMTYANVVYSYGPERFLSRCEELEIDGLILPDVPFEEKDEFQPVCSAHHVDLISMIAPTSANRIEKIAREAEGFLYIVSSLGVTGERSSFASDLKGMCEEIRLHTDLPCAIGFGIHSPRQAAEMAQIADGVIVGSAIVSLIGEQGKEAVDPVRQYVHSMTDALKTE